MNTTEIWLSHFEHNAKIRRVNWCQLPRITKDQINTILKSLQAWQLGETSDGRHLMAASKKYADKFGDRQYPKVVELFIKEEQKHGDNLGLYLDLIGAERIKYNWGDSLFRFVRYFMTSMEIWTTAVLTVESAAQIFYQALKDATSCPLLKEICTDILIDEASHIQFQFERMTHVYNQKSRLGQYFSSFAYRAFFCLTIRVIWFAHESVFIAGGLHRRKYIDMMDLKYAKTFGRLKQSETLVYLS